MYTGSLLINQHIICSILKIFQNNIEIINELIFGNQFDPLDKNMDISSLEDHVVPFALLYQIKHIAYW